MRILRFLAVLLLPHAADAATLRPMSVLHDPVVRLSDLFDTLGATADRPLGPAPAPGGSVVVEAAQLGAIARQFGVDWRPTSNADRAVLERPGRPLDRAAVLDAVRAALIAAGAPGDCEIVLPNFTSPNVPLDTDTAPVVTQLQYDSTSGRFAGMLSVTAAGLEPINTRITGNTEAILELPVASTRLATGTVLRDGDVHIARIRAALVRADVARTLEQAVGKQLRHQVPAGQPLKRADLMPPELILKGQSVQMVLESAGLLLIGQGQAMDSAGAGARVRVLNPVSRAVLEGTVVGPGRVRIDPDSRPVSPAGGRDGIAGQVAIR